MITILILGGYGYTGKLLTKHLLTHSQAQIILAGRNIEKAQKFADEICNERVSISCVDAAAFSRADSSVIFLGLSLPVNYMTVQTNKSYCLH